jgi:hypothetical protein
MDAKWHEEIDSLTGELDKRQYSYGCVSFKVHCVVTFADESQATADGPFLRFLARQYIRMEEVEAFITIDKGNNMVVKSVWDPQGKLVKRQRWMF